MTFYYKTAELVDVPVLVMLKQSVWPDESATVAQVERGLQQPGHLTVIAFQSDRPVGFASSIPTTGVHGQRRWDLDLLGVRAEARGQRLGTRLVEESLARLALPAGVPMRSLIATSNVASQIAFQRAGYALQDGKLGLFITALTKTGTQTAEQIPACLIPIQTLNYSGYWLEAIERPEALGLAAGLPATASAQIVGALLPAGRTDLLVAADEAGYAHVGDYQQWRFVGK